MLRELFEAAVSKADASVRRLGYVHESVAIAARHRRNTEAWAPHLERTRRFVAQAATGGESIAVLGSGSLLDVPLELLLERYRYVALVDCVHPRSAVRASRRHARVTLHTLDVTGCAEALQRGETPTPPLPVLGPSIDDADVIVSLNLLSQLPVVPMLALEARGLGPSEQQRFGRALISRHLEYLRGRPGRAVLVTDVSRTFERFQSTGERRLEQGDDDAMLGVELPRPDEAWPWVVAPRGELKDDLMLTLHVSAYADLRA